MKGEVQNAIARTLNTQVNAFFVCFDKAAFRFNVVVAELSDSTLKLLAALTFTVNFISVLAVLEVKS